MTANIRTEARMALCIVTSEEWFVVILECVLQTGDPCCQVPNVTSSVCVAAIKRYLLNVSSSALIVVESAMIAHHMD